MWILRNGNPSPLQVFASEVREIVSNGGLNVQAEPKKRGKKSKQTPAQLASRQIQGRFLGLLRYAPKSKQNTYRALAKEQGRVAAIAAMLQARG